MTKQLFLFFFLICALSACRNEKENKQAKAHVTVVDTLSYTYDSVVVYSKNVIKSTAKTADTTKASISFPIFKDETLNNYLKTQVTSYISPEEKSTSYQYIADSFVKGYDDFYKENKSSNQYWFLIIDLNVINQKANYIALQYLHSDFSGGAHPNTNFSLINYNPKTNVAITLDSLIDPSNKAKLISKAEAIFRKNEKLTPNETLTGKYFFNDDKFSLPENFYVNDKGLVFLYNPYEIKAYVEGTTELTIPFAALKDIAKPNTILTSTH